jgi:L-lactate dehydrogenase complex protein LldG
MATFLTEAQRVSASVVVLNSAADVPGEVARWLREANLPLEIRIGADERLTQLDWQGTAMTMHDGASAGTDLSAVSHAFAGVAETGSVILLSGPANPVTLNFLPDNHIVVLAAADLFGDLESVWGKLRHDHGKGVMPRTLNIITGPSRSADIEQTLLLGAHGPRSLHILITLA